MSYEIKFDSTPMLGGCEICLQNECGAEGSVQFPGMPIQIGVACAWRIAIVLPQPGVPQPEKVGAVLSRARRSRTQRSRRARAA